MGIKLRIFVPQSETAAALLGPASRTPRGTVPTYRFHGYVTCLQARVDKMDFTSGEAIFDAIVSKVEPFSVLNNTLRRWISGLPHDEVRSGAEDVLLCFRVDLLCDAVFGWSGSCDSDNAFRPCVLCRSLGSRAPPAGPRVFHRGMRRSMCAHPQASHCCWVFCGIVPSCTLKDMRKHLWWLQCCVSWISAVLRLARAGRRLTRTFATCPPLLVRSGSACLAPCPAFSVCFTL